MAKWQDHGGSILSQARHHPASFQRGGERSEKKKNGGVEMKNCVERVGTLSSTCVHARMFKILKLAVLRMLGY